MAVLDWIDFRLVGLGAVALAGISFFMTVVILPLVVTQLPQDYFVNPRRPTHREALHPALATAAAAAKNLVGLALLIAGALLLFTPGPGIVSILVGLLLTNFPGKYAIERRLARHPSVFAAMNRIRARANKPPLHAPQD